MSWDEEEFEEEDSEEATFNMLNSWIFGDPDPLLQSFAKGEWGPCGKPDRQLFRAIVTNGQIPHSSTMANLESWSKSKEAALAFIKKEYKNFAEGKTVFLVAKTISSSDQIVDMADTDVDDVYGAELEVICKTQSIDQTNVVATYQMKNGELL